MDDGELEWHRVRVPWQLRLEVFDGRHRAHNDYASAEQHPVNFVKLYLRLLRAGEHRLQ